MLSEGLGLRRLAGQEVDHALHHPGGVGFTRMHSGRNENAFFGESFGGFGVFVLAGDGEILAPVACKRSGERAPMEKVLS